MMKKNIQITTDEAESLIDFIENIFIESVRQDEWCDNVEYVANICSVWKKCKLAVEGEKK